MTTPSKPGGTPATPNPQNRTTTSTTTTTTVSPNEDSARGELWSAISDVFRDVEWYFWVIGGLVMLIVTFVIIVLIIVYYKRKRAQKCRIEDLTKSAKKEKDDYPAKSKDNVIPHKPHKEEKLHLPKLFNPWDSTTPILRYSDYLRHTPLVTPEIYSPPPPFFLHPFDYQNGIPYYQAGRRVIKS